MTDPLRRQSDEARQILNTCTPSTPRLEVAWAAGVITARHAADLVQIPIPPGRIAPEYSGGSLERGRRYLATRKGFEVNGISDTPPHPTGLIVRVAWREIADLVRPELVEHLRPRIATAMAERRATTYTHDQTLKRADWFSPKRLAREERRRAAEEECSAVGAEVWELCRPNPQPKQLDLLDLLATASRAGQ